MDTYDVGDRVQVRESFAVGSTPTDPTALTARVRRPDGTQVVYAYASAPALVRESAGNYRLDLTPDQVGTWWVAFEATGTVQDTRESAFAVRAEQATAGPGAALCAVGDLEALIQVPIPAADQDWANAAIAAASGAIRAYTNQMLTLVEDDELVLSGGGGPLLLPELPVVAVSAVSVDGTALASSDFTFEANTGELIRLGTWPPALPYPTCWAYGYRNVAVTYTHGYDPLPAEIANVCAEAASRRYLAGRRSALVGPHARDASLGGVFQGEDLADTQGAYGPTALPILLRSEKERLDRYRLARLG